MPVWFDSSSSHWVYAEWDSPSTESTRSETSHQLSQHGVRLHVNWVNAEGTIIYEDFIILRWLSWRGVSLRVDSVDVESHLALTQLTGNETRRQLSHRRMLKYSNKSANSSTKSKRLKSLIIWPIYVWSVQKSGTRKSHASVPLSKGMPSLYPGLDVICLSESRHTSSPPGNSGTPLEVCTTPNYQSSASHWR
jgi:hypothetical protein